VHECTQATQVPSLSHSRARALSVYRARRSSQRADLLRTRGRRITRINVRVSESVSVYIYILYILYILFIYIYIHIYLHTHTNTNTHPHMCGWVGGCMYVEYKQQCVPVEGTRRWFFLRGTVWSSSVTIVFWGRNLPGVLYIWSTLSDTDQLLPPCCCCCLQPYR
jgi:hypothetical protein